MLRKTIGKVIFGISSNSICREVYYTDYRRSTIGVSTVYCSTVYILDLTDLQKCKQYLRNTG